MIYADPAVSERASGQPQRDLSVTEPRATRSFGLTRRQTLFWLDEQLFPSAPYHHVVLTVRLTGHLDVERLYKAYRATVVGFDQFRLTFVERQGEPQQLFSLMAEPVLEQVDLSARPDSAASVLHARAAQRFDLSKRAFDGALFKLSEREHVFYFCQHHIISDGTSVGLFLSDLAARYSGQTPPLRPSYADFLREEEAYRASPRAERDARYFSEKLANATAPLKLYGRTRQSRAVGIERSFLDGGAARWQQLSALTRDPRIEFIDTSMSRFVALATVLLAFLYRVGESRSVVIGTPVPNRSAKFAGIGGLMMEQLFLAVHIEEGESFASLAAKVRSEMFGGLRHGRHCVSDRGVEYATFNMLRIPSAHFGEQLTAHVELTPVAASGASLTSAQGDLRDSFGVHILGFESGETLRIGFDFHRETYEPALRARARGHFLALLDGLLTNLDTLIDHVSLADADEEAELLGLARGAEPVEATPDPIVRLLQTAEAHPERTAVVFDAQQVSYGALVAQMGRLASRLRELGVSTGSRVGICVERGTDELLSMLAVWAAGAAYVPLDPTHPPERIRMILEDAAPEVLITHAEVLRGLDVPSTVQLLQVDQERVSLSNRAPYVATEVDPEQLAYILFTSGSTGRPKGVAVSRRAIANFLRSMAHTPGMTASDRLLAVTTITFDIAELELHLPLWVGGSVHVASREMVLDASKLREVLESQPITIMQATPTTWRLLVEAGYQCSRTPLRILCGGEPISPELALALSERGELWNMYGPTETTVWSTIKRLSHDEKITVGRPIDHTQVYVLDALGQVLPVGVIGELCIGGRGVASGYYGRPELTELKFLQNRYVTQTDLVYRTGDLARFLPDGELECLGRVDHQVKVRGFRIELGEIESCLRSAPGVRDAVVTAVTEAGEPRLIAYWIGEGHEQAMIKRVRSALPSYMQPYAFVQLDAFPLNTNGKVDRARLPVPAAPMGASVLTGLRAVTDHEAQMAALFEEVLDLTNVPVDRDFFELGGDSVRAIKLRRRIQEVLGVELPLGVLFDRPTVQRLVGALSPTVDAKQPVFVRLRRGHEERSPLLCIFGVTLYRPLADALATNRAVYGMHVPYSLNPKDGLPRLQDLAARYVDLILSRVEHGPYHLAGLCFGGLVAYEVARELKARGYEVGSLALIDAPLPSCFGFSLSAAVQMLSRHSIQSPGRLSRRIANEALALPSKLAASHWLSGLKKESKLDREIELEVVGPIADGIVHRYEGERPRYDGPVTVFRAIDRSESSWRRASRDLGWSRLARDVRVIDVAGSHLAILQQPHVEKMARAMSELL